MAVTAVEKIWSGHDGNFQVDNSGILNGTLVEVYNVFVDDPENDDALVVVSAPGIPRINQQWPTDFYFRAKLAVPKRVSPIQFVVTVTYRSIEITPGDPNPFNRPAVVRWATVKETGEIDEDIHGNPLVTANGEPIRGITRPFSNLAAVIERNIPNFNPQAFDGFIDRVDNSGILGSTPGTAVLDSVNADPVENDDFRYYKLVSTVLFRRPIRTTAARAWWYRTMHKGFEVREEPGGEPSHAITNGDLVSSPVRLKPDGTRETDDNVAHFLEFEILESVNLSASGII